MVDMVYELRAFELGLDLSTIPGHSMSNEPKTIESPYAPICMKTGSVY